LWDEKDGMSTRTMHGAMYGMGRKMTEYGMGKTMHGAMNGMGRKLGGYIWMGKDECHGTTDEKK
jgi:hypothetical protein